MAWILYDIVESKVYILRVCAGTKEVPDVC